MNYFKWIHVLLCMAAIPACAHSELEVYNEEPTAEPQPLGMTFSPHFTSYASIETTQELLHSRGYTWKVLPGELFAQHLMSTLVVEDYIHLGFHGKAVVIFSNDRLMLFEFFPALPSRSLRKYSASAQDYHSSLSQDDHRAGVCLDCRVLGAMKTPTTGSGMAWADRRLVSESPEFIGIQSAPLSK